MSLIDKIFGKLNFSFIWKDNNKKIVKLSDGKFQLHQEHSGVTNILNIESLNVTVQDINNLAGLNVPENPYELLQNMGQRWIVEQQFKQQNFQKTVAKAELVSISEPKSLESDWFLKWMEISQGVSKENVQEILAKILNSEVTQQGSFSLRTLEVLKNLSKKELELFQIFCDISFAVPQLQDGYTCVVCEPFGNPGDNGLSSLNLPYSHLTKLQNAGLIHTELNAWKLFPIPLLLEMPHTIGSEVFAFQSTNETIGSTPRVKVINFTDAGLELRSVLSLNTNSEYNKKFTNWVESTWKMIPLKI